MISHSSCRDAGKNTGDLGDAQLGALARNGGVACMHFFANYVRDHAATIDDLVDHILHVAKVAGIDHVGLGPDWLPLTPDFVRVNAEISGLPPDYVRPPDQPLGPVAELSDIDKLPRLTERLVERGLADEDIRKVLGANLIRVYRQVERGVPPGGSAA